MSIETQKTYNLVIGILSILDENVISEDDYVLIKEKNANVESDLRFISDVVLKSWFLESEPNRRDRIIQSILCVIESGEYGANVLFGALNFVFDYEIIDKIIFLKRIKCFFEEYVANS